MVNVNNDHYSRLLMSIAEAAVTAPRTRAGFGALRQYAEVYKNTVQVIMESAYLSPGAVDYPWVLPQHVRTLYEQTLTDPAFYDPSSLWALFWALAQAEHEFLMEFTPGWSHEERLTGHLVSQIRERIREFKPHWAALDLPTKPAGAFCEVTYSDIATDRREKRTGADFGLIIHGKMIGRGKEFFKAARFQAKKTNDNGKATIVSDQTDALLSMPNLGYYVFYHRYSVERWSLAPTVRSALDFKDCTGSTTADATDHAFDFASFLTFAMADPQSNFGVMTSSARKSLDALFPQDVSSTPLSRVLVISLGSNLTPVNWDELLGGHHGRDERTE